jgi:uncharacterized protein involved in type VI secretion and phage assembly
MNRHYASGPVYGIVTNNADPDGLGRVKVQLYHLGSDIETNWIPILTVSLGVFVIPEVGDQVIVAFMGDNPDLPIVIGGQWSQKQRPPLTGENSASDLNKDGKNNLRFINSRSGNRIILDDTKGKEKIQFISSKSTSRIEITATDTGILLDTAKGIKIKAKGAINIEGKKCNIKMKKGLLAQSENIKADGKKDVKVNAGNGITVKGKGINLN